MNWNEVCNANPYILSAIAIAVPSVIGMVKKYIASPPQELLWVIPLLAPILGMVSGELVALTTAYPNCLLLSAVAGAAGIGVREMAHIPAIRMGLKTDFNTPKKVA